MWRYLVLILLSIKICNAVNSVGVTTLFYPLRAESRSILMPSSESNLNDIESKLNQVMISQVQTPKITTVLKQKLIESGTFNVFDGDKVLISWGATESGIANWGLESSHIEKQTIDNIVLESVVKIKPPNKSNKYLLIGFIKSIDANEVKQVFTGTNNTSILYSIDIEVMYKLVDVDTKAVVNKFIAIGHGGFARIISSDIIHMAQNPEDSSDYIINEAINSLVMNVKHELLIKDGLGVIPH